MKAAILSLIHAFFDIPRIAKRVVTVFFDSTFIIGGLLLALWVRLGSETTKWLHETVFFLLLITAILSIIVWAYLGFYRAVIRFMDIKVLSTLVLGSFSSSLFLLFGSFILNANLPRSVPIIYFAIILILAAGSRLVVRGLISARSGEVKAPVLIYGAGSSGRQLSLSLQHGAEYNPIAFIDDNIELHNTSVTGIRVFSPQQIEMLIEKNAVSKVLLAIPSASPMQRKKLLLLLEKTAVEVLTIPGSADLVSGRLQVNLLRRVDIVDLLGRVPVEPINQLISHCIENKVVMVTGAGGSIGSELCRQILKENPRKLILFESCEFNLYAIESELKKLIEKEHAPTLVYSVLGCVQKMELIAKVIGNYKVNTIYHAAAYKHVPLVEQNIINGIQNNVWGTLNCAKAALVQNVDNFVLISTDKAVRPTNIMGATKRLAELVLQSLAENTKKTRFSIVRFGNVLGSSGSVVPLFKKQIANGGPITITHPEITRYFMTIPEAAQLVIQAGSMGQGGEVYVLDMGKPIRIQELAIKMIKLSGLSIKDQENPSGDIEIKYTGLRPGEKLYEELLIGKDVEGTEHKRIMKANEISISVDELQHILDNLEDAIESFDVCRIRKLLINAPLGYEPNSEIVDCMLPQAPLEGSVNSRECLKIV
ncbi:nucleoside-diphosphate sugar epimerase/dehydratase [Pseudoalteromonas sp.]|uniref:polysaccharide biosynthesis protein n=1 Tax=Pseudoalteromonas sp. TaxID=53249 RepID=UPI0025CCF15A|nr:nucleoside-diphosphate sugar epimerase/dehydratase [Pseudoalteromonas sp.]